MGDIESAPFIEAMRQFQFKVGVENFALVYVSLIPVVGGEQKTKPTQAGVRDLRGLGLLPDIVSLTLRDCVPGRPTRPNAHPYHLRRPYRSPVDANTNSSQPPWKKSPCSATFNRPKSSGFTTSTRRTTSPS